jgi:hypothetical protein
MTSKDEEKMKEKSSHRIMMDWKQNPDKSLRLGQYFCNIYMTNAWPELYYEKQASTALTYIDKWLIDHHYEYNMPPLRKDKI